MNHLKLIFRNLKKNKISTFINFFGLSTSIAVFVLISLHLYNEITTDRFHLNYERIYRMAATDFNGTVDMPAPLADMIVDKVSDIDKICRLDFTHSWSTNLKYENQNYNQKNILFADSTFFKIFSFNIEIGNQEKALSQPGSIVLTRSLAQKIFGKNNPINKQLLFQNEALLTVTAVLEDLPSNSSINFSGIVSFETLKLIGTDYSKEWGNFNYETYCLVQHSNITEIENKVNDEFKNIQPEREGTIFSIHPFKGLYLQPNYSDGGIKQGNLQSIIFLFISAILIIVLAVVNFINLNLSSISQRIKSLSIQKIIGAQKRHILFLLFQETVFIFFLSVVIGLLMSYIFLPIQNNLLSSTLKFSVLFSPLWIISIFVSLILLSFISAYLPFIVISKQKIMLALKGNAIIGNNKTKTWQVLLTGQFVITIVLIISSILINKQLHYINNKDLGFKKDNTFLLFIEKETGKNYNLLKNSLYHYPQFKHISLSHSTPGTIGMQWGGKLKFRGEEKEVSFFSVPVTPGYLEMMGYRLKRGRFFNDSLESDKGTFILNEAAIKKYGITEAPLEAKIVNFGEDVGKIIGVVGDFHFQSFHEKIKPLAFNYIPQWGNNMCSLVNIKSDSENVEEDLNIIKKEFLKVMPDTPFQSFTIDSLLSESYQKERNLNRMISFFSFLSIIIGCLGLLGIVNITIVARIKEIGIRKVNGAKVSEILAKLNKDFIKWIVAAFVIATPLAHWTMNKWLENFAYKTTLSWWIFALAGMLALGISLLTISLQSWKAASRNPVEALRYE